MRKNAVADVDRCGPEICARSFGGCLAMTACAHHLLEREGIGEPPLLLSATASIGCGKCSAGCPAGAISVARGVAAGG